MTGLRGFGDEVTAAAPACIREGCQFSKARGVLAQAQQLLIQRGREGMSQALWCDQGGHAFSERDPGRQRISATVLDPETQEEVSISKDFCGPHAVESGLTTPRKTHPASLTARAEPQ